MLTCKACGVVSDPEEIEALKARPCEVCRTMGEYWEEINQVPVMAGMNFYLDEKGEPKEAKTLGEWCRGFEKAERQLERTKIGRVTVSTIFLGLNHRWGDGPPILWETMVLGGRFKGRMDRCAGSREQAGAMHAKICAMVRSGKWEDAE